MLAENLELRGFELALDTQEAEQLLVVHAGTTNQPSIFSFNSTSIDDFTYASFASPDDSQLWSNNVRLLGYARAYDDLIPLPGMSELAYQDITNELSKPRNYIVVTAYDFNRARTEENAPVLWRTHISVEAGPTPFAHQVDTLVSTASRFLGRSSKRLVRRFNSDVHIGPATVVEEDIDIP